MAIAFARARYISRRSGGNAVRSSAYNGRDKREAERTGEVFFFAHRDAPEHHEVLLPAGAPESFRDAGVLWNAAEAAERRGDAQVAREIVLALPANHELGPEDRIELARSFALEHFVSKGLAVQIDVHAPHGADSDSERANHHAHLLITTRRVEADGLAAKKARDLEPVVRQSRGRATVSEAEAWGASWRDHQNRFFAAHGLDLRVDATSAVPQEHIGPIRMRAPEAEAHGRADKIRDANAQAARDPARVLEVLTRNNATFTTRDLDRHLAKHIGDAVERDAVRVQVLDSKDVLMLHDRETGEAVERFTTRAVRDQEREALADGAALTRRGAHHDIGPVARAAASSSAQLRPDQRAALDHATGAGGLKIIEGRAGTGKSFTLAAIREAHEAAGYEVIALAPTNAVAQDLGADGFKRASTVHAELFRLKNGHAVWGPRTLVVVDEMAMLDAKVTGALLREARLSGAKVVGAGDDRQLAAIERGGLFTELRQAHGSATITQVTRQRVDWQREAARDLSEGRFEEALRAFARNKAIVWTNKQDEARKALVARWTTDTAADPSASRFVFAYTNKDVDILNRDLRSVRRERGELGADHVFTTKHGEAAYAAGDRVQFTDTLKGAGIYNGNAGVITAIDRATGRISATLDAAAGKEGRQVSWSASEFAGFRHGYAGTIYKGQGKTLDQTYLLHTQHWRAASSYVALTRQRESATVFAAVEVAADIRQLARQIGRTEIKAASVAYATADELTPAQRVRQTETLRTGPSEKAQTRDSARTDETTRPTPSPRHEPSRRATRDAAIHQRMPEPVLLPGYDGQGRDSLNRGLDDASLRAVVLADRQVRAEKDARALYLRNAYRDSEIATARLSELVERDGMISAARRLTAEPGLLGDLRGRDGLFAGSRAKQEWMIALQAATAIGPNLACQVAAEAQAVQGYRISVTEQMAADRTPVPRLSERAHAALGQVAGAETDADRRQAMQALIGDVAVKTEVDGFRTAVETRFGADGARQMARLVETGRAITHGSVPRDQQPAFETVAKHYAALRGGELVLTQAALSERMSVRQTQGARLKP